jgi:hypothetical protein
VRPAATSFIGELAAFGLMRTQRCVLSHAGFPSLKGGFAGVDVFFVISGFLMASLILTEIGEGPNHDENANDQNGLTTAKRLTQIKPSGIGVSDDLFGATLR